MLVGGFLAASNLSFGPTGSYLTLRKVLFVTQKNKGADTTAADAGAGSTY